MIPGRPLTQNQRSKEHPGEKSKEQHPIRLLFYSQAEALAGGERILSELLRRLPEDRYEVACVCTSLEMMTSLQRGQDSDDVRFLLFDQGSRPSVWRTVLPLARLMARFKPDIIHCNGIDQYGCAYAILAGRLIRTPVVIGTVHTAGPHPQRKLPDKLFAWVIDRMLDAAILVSNYCRIPVLRDRHLDANDLIVIHNGVDLGNSPATGRHYHRSSYEVRGRPIIIGSAGQLIAHKGFATLLEAAHLLSQEHDLEVRIFGEGPDWKRLDQLIQEINMTGRFHLCGWSKDIYDALQTLDIFVLPSSNESAGLVILEAMACALPVVATNVGGIPEYVADSETGLLVPTGNSPALAEAIATLIVAPDKRKSLGLAGRERVERLFNVERMVSETDQLYRSLLRAKRHSLGSHTAAHRAI